MIVPIQERRIPTATPDELPTAFSYLFRGVVPGFIVPYDETLADGDTFQGVCDAFLTAGGIIETPLPAILGKYSFGWHTDGTPKSGERLMYTNINGNVEGESGVRLGVTRPLFWQVPRDVLGMPPSLHNLLAEGQVDDNLMRPEIWVGNVGVGGVIAFSAKGVRPAPHEFTTTTGPRLSLVHAGFVGTRHFVQVDRGVDHELMLVGAGSPR